jgi:hypothetical protein
MILKCLTALEMKTKFSFGAKFGVKIDITFNYMMTVCGRPVTIYIG